MSVGARRSLYLDHAASRVKIFYPFLGFVTSKVKNQLKGKLKRFQSMNMEAMP